MASPVKALSAILFSMGSVLLVVEFFVKIVIKGRSVSDSIMPTRWSAFGLLGLLGWAIGIVLLVVLRLSAPGVRKDRKNIFLAGKRSFKCASCGRTMDASRVGFHQRMDCPCGAIYNVFQETEWEREP